MASPGTPHSAAVTPAGRAYPATMRILPPLLLSCLLLPACTDAGDDAGTELTIVAPDADRVLIRQDGGDWVDLAAGDDVRTRVTGPFTLVGVCFAGLVEHEVVVIRASAEDGTRWWLGTCKPKETATIAVDPRFANTELIAGITYEQWLTAEDGAIAPRGRQDLIFRGIAAEGEEASIVRDFDVQAGAVVSAGEPLVIVPMPAELNDLPNDRYGRASILTRHGTYWPSFEGMILSDQLGTDEQAQITTYRQTYQSLSVDRGAFTRFTLRADLPPLDVARVDDSMAAAIDEIDARITAGTIDVTWSSANAFDDQIVTIDGGMAPLVLWTISSYAGWIAAEAGRERTTSFDYRDIPSWPNELNIDTSLNHQVQTQLGLVRSPGVVVGGWSADRLPGAQPVTATSRR